MSKRALLSVAVTLSALLTLYIGTAIVLVFRPEPQFSGKPLPSAARPTPGSALATREFAMRDGANVRALEFSAPGATTTVVLLHGVMSSARGMAMMASRIRQSGGADVLALDLRGHGASDGAPGDVAYAGQYEDDVADVVDGLKRSKPGHRIVLGGYSMGGGIVLRYADRKGLPPVDGYLLLAPHIGQSSPTSRNEPVDAATAAASPMQVHVPRTIGLGMLNVLGIEWWNDKPTLFFNMAAGAPLSRYTFRAMVGTTPSNYRTALEADDLPLLTIVGSKDESFHVDRFTEVIGLHRNGTLRIVEGATHFTLGFNKSVAETAGAWIRERR